MQGSTKGDVKGGMKGGMKGGSGGPDADGLWLFHVDVDDLVGHDGAPLLTVRAEPPL